MSCAQIWAAVISSAGGCNPAISAQFVARENGLQRDRRLRALIRRNVRVQPGDDFTGGGLLVSQVRGALRQFADDRHARLQTFRRAKIRH